MPTSRHVIARIVRHDELPTGCRRIVAEAPEVAETARPGQFVHVLCNTAGTDPLLRRPLSIHSAEPQSGTVALLYEIRGRGTRLLSERSAGESLDILGPLGNGFELPESADQPIILVGGGMGGAPLYFLVEYIRKGVGSNRVTSIMGASTVSRFHFVDTFREFCDGESHRLCTDDGTCGRRGFVTDVLGEYLDARSEPYKPLIYACGPAPMLKAVSSMANLRGVRCQISMEAKMGCGIGACMSCAVLVRRNGEERYLRACKEGPVFDAAEVVWGR